MTFMMQRMSENDEIVTRYLDDDIFRKIAMNILAKEICENINPNKSA